VAKITLMLQVRAKNDRFVGIQKVLDS
jgi:hypothetical protein